MSGSLGLYNTVPKHTYIDFDGLKAVADFLEFDRNDISKAFNISKQSIRYDEHIPKEVKLRLEEIAIVCQLVAEYFGGDIQKTAIWFRLKNPAIGNISPRDMIRFGQFDKLYQFIIASRSGETP